MLIGRGQANRERVHPMGDLPARLHQWDRALSARIALPADASSSRRAWLPSLGAHLGDSWLWLLIWGVLWRDARRRRHADGGRRESLVQSWLAAVIVSIAVTIGIKQVVQRPRPGSGTLLYGSGPDVHSFPSGHAARISTIAMWAGLLAPHDQRQLGSLAGLVLAFTIGWSRVRLGIHYVGDVLAGYLLGGTIGFLSRRWWQQRHQPPG